MLVLTRKTGQQIHIGDDITIVVSRVAGNRVAIAIDAPEDIRVMRGELQEVRQQFDAPVEEPVALSPTASFEQVGDVVAATPQAAR